MSAPSHPFVVFALLASLVACRGGDAPEERVPVQVGRGVGSEQAATQEGDIRITDENGGIELALVGDSISAGLSPKALSAARLEMDTTKVRGTDLGASIERIVKQSVHGALSTRASVPLASVRDVRYEDGELRFEWNGTAPSFGTTTTNGKPLMKSFRPDDARRFVDAVRARKRRAIAS